MISYCNPTCPITHNRATLFCYDPNCTQTAFGCSADCLIEDGHAGHKTAQWRVLEEDVRQAVELPLAKEELQLLEKQEKQLKIVIEELKLIHSNHERAILKCKKRLQLKGTAEKVIAAIRNKNSKSVTGSNMACLLNEIQNSNLFKNTKSVQISSQERNSLINELIANLTKLIQDHKLLEISLPEPQKIPNIDSAELTAKFMVDSANSDAVVIENGVFTVRPGTYLFHPVFAKQQLRAGQTCEIQVVDAVVRNFMIGVATTDLRNKTHEYKDINSLCLFAYNGTLFSNGNQQQHHFEIQTGDIVSMRRNGHQIEWIRGESLLCSAPLSSRLSSQPIFPVMWILSWDKPTDSTKLRFL